MSFVTLSMNWQMTALFFLTLLPLCFVMKLVAFWNVLEGRKNWVLMLSPFPTPTAAKQTLPLSAGPWMIRRFLVALSVCFVAYWLYWNFWEGLQLPPVLRSYVGAFMLWIVSEALGSLATFIAMPSGRLLPLPHGATPPLAKGLSDFWARRWNVWTSAWFRQVIFRPMQNRPVIALFAVFLTSGVLHELVINVPLYIVTGRKYFGWMTLYYLLQPIGILIEHRTHNRGIRILLVWLFVLGAVPLMVNEGLLRVLHLWPE